MSSAGPKNKQDGNKELLQPKKNPNISKIPSDATNPKSRHVDILTPMLVSMKDNNLGENLRQEPSSLSFIAEKMNQDPTNNGSNKDKRPTTTTSNETAIRKLLTVKRQIDVPVEKTLDFRKESILRKATFVNDSSRLEMNRKATTLNIPKRDSNGNL
jgi:hypothetical protein